MDSSKDTRLHVDVTGGTDPVLLMHPWPAGSDATLDAGETGAQARCEDG
jgi:hypothetical protein